jgi:hypothetical protein
MLKHWIDSQDQTFCLQEEIRYFCSNTFWSTMSKHREIVLGFPLNSMSPLHHHAGRAIRGQISPSVYLQAVLEQSSVLSELITFDRRFPPIASDGD